MASHESPFGGELSLPSSRVIAFGLPVPALSQQVGVSPVVKRIKYNFLVWGFS